MSFPKRLFELRIQHSLTITGLSRLTDISIASLSAYEKGAYMPNLENLCTLADFFEVSLDYLLGRTDHPLL